MRWSVLCLALSGCWQVASAVSPLAGSLATPPRGYENLEIAFDLGGGAVDQVSTEAEAHLGLAIGGRWRMLALLVRATPSVVPARHTSLVPVDLALRLHLGPVWLEGLGGLVFDGEQGGEARWGAGGGLGWDFYRVDWRTVGLAVRSSYHGGDQPITLIGGGLEIRY